MGLKYFLCQVVTRFIPTINPSLLSVDRQTVSNFLQDLQTYQSGNGDRLALNPGNDNIFDKIFSNVRGSREAVHLDVENELREAMSDTIKEDGKCYFIPHFSHLSKTSFLHAF